MMFCASEVCRKASLKPIFRSPGIVLVLVLVLDSVVFRTGTPVFDRISGLSRTGTTTSTRLRVAGNLTRALPREISRLPK
jgi:hypothetical protein